MAPQIANLLLRAMMELRPEARRQYALVLGLERAREEAGARDAFGHDVADARAALGAKVAVPVRSRRRLEQLAAGGDGKVGRLDVAHLVERCAVRAPAALAVAKRRTYRCSIGPDDKAHGAAVAPAAQAGGEVWRRRLAAAASPFIPLELNLHARKRRERV